MRRAGRARCVRRSGSLNDACSGLVGIPTLPRPTIFTLPWDDGAQFSFDIGGVLQGGDLDGSIFLAETKKYSNAQNQQPAYIAFLAKCYRVLAEYPGRAKVFLWITWAPFMVTNWSTKAALAVSTALARTSSDNR